MVGNNTLFELDFEEDKAQELSIDDFSDQIAAGRQGLKIFHMNVCSIKAKFKQLEILFHIMKDVFDCIVLGETHTKEEINLNQFSLGDYNIYQTKFNKRRTDGLIVYVRSTLIHEVSEIELSDCNCLVIKIEKCKKSFVLNTFYRSPNGKIDVFLSELKPILHTLSYALAMSVYTTST